MPSYSIKEKEFSVLVPFAITDSSRKSYGSLSFLDVVGDEREPSLIQEVGSMNKEESM